MAAFDALTFMFMIFCGALALVFAIFKLPELSVIFLIGVYYFSVFHIAQTVGESRGWHREILKTYFCILALTILTFATIYYRYGLMQNGQHVDITIMESIYFSITTWTTLGYGDFSPVARIRHITSAEAILGYIGLGLWVFLISNFINNMATNRQEIREHNARIVAEFEESQQKKDKSND